MSRMTPHTADDKPRWVHRYDSYTRALALLREAIQAMRTHTIKDLEKEGLIKRFEFVCELGWKLQKDYLENEGVAIDLSSPSSIVKEAFTFRLIPSAELWMNAIKDRNLSAHIYDRDTAEAILGRIIDLHLPLFDALHRKLLDYLPPNDRPATSHGLAERHIAIIRDIFAPYADRVTRVDLFGLLVAAGDGAIMAGPVGTTPPMLDGGEWTHLFAGGTTQAARAGRDSFCQNRWRGKRRGQLVTKRITTGSPRGHKPCVSGR